MQIVDITREVAVGAILLAVCGAAAHAQKAPRTWSVAESSGAATASEGSAAALAVSRSSRTSSAAFVTLDVTRLPLRDVLDEIARQSGVHLYYSRYVVPLDRQVSLTVREASAVQALEKALVNTGVAVRQWSPTQIVLERAEAVGRARGVRQLGSVHGRVVDAKTSVGIAAARVAIDSTSLGASTDESGGFRITSVPVGEHVITARRIGYAPLSQHVTVAADEDVTLDFALEQSANLLDQVVVTGTVAPTEVRALPTPITVVTADDIERLGITDIAKIFRGTVPGAVTLDEGTHDGYPALSFRGGVSVQPGDTPVKVYLDGIEIAYTNTLTQIDPKTIDHLEITRGPQASTIYGAGAMVGVIQIFTKTGTAGLTHPRVDAQAAAGGLQSQWGNTTLHQDHSLGIAGGNGALSYAGRVSYTGTGAWTPEYKSQRSLYSASVSSTIGAVQVQVAGQFSHRIYNVDPVDPYFVSQVRAGNWHTASDGFYTHPFYPDVTRNDGTFGLNLQYRATPWLTNRLVLGFDGYDNPRGLTQPRETTPADTMRAYSEFHRSRVSAAYNATLETKLGSDLASTLTVGVDHWQTHEMVVSAKQRGDGTFASGATFIKYLYGNTGLFAQEQFAIANALFLTAGVRGDRNDNFGTDFGTAVSPRVGASYAGAIANRLTFKVRASYGTAIQAPLPIQKDAIALNLPTSEQLANLQLGPTKQSGYDAGLELYFGRHGSIQATYYDQHVDNLISLLVLSAPGEVPRLSQYANVGRIRNTGWELQGAASVGQISISATYSIFNSIAQQLNAGSIGDGMQQYHPGDRLLTIPRSSGGLIASWAARGTQLSTGLTYIGSFRNYDRIAYYDATLGPDPTGQPARTFIIDYPASVKLNARISQDLSSTVSAFVQVDNLANSYRPEIDNVTTVYGRLTVVGLRARW